MGVGRVTGRSTGLAWPWGGQMKTRIGASPATPGRPALTPARAPRPPLAPAPFGRSQPLSPYPAVITVLVDLGFNTLYVREAARHPGEISRYLSNMVAVRLAMSLLGLAVLAL